MTNAYIAVDSGGTRTTVTLSVERDGEEPERRTREVYESLSGYLKPTEYVSVLRRIISPAEALWHDTNVEAGSVHVFISAAGFSAASRSQVLDAVKEVIPDTFGGAVTSIGVANDAVSLLLGHDAEAVVVAGTGSSVLVRRTDGTIFQSGGEEWVANDYGAGFWIGLDAIRAVARAFEAGQETPLLHRFCNEYHVEIDDPDAIIGRFRTLAVADNDMKADIAKFSSAVCSAAQKGDDEAQRIVKAQAEDLARSLVVALRRRLATDQLEDGLSIVQCGSVFESPFYRSSFEAMVSISLYGTTDTADLIHWEPVGDGREAASRLAHTVHHDPDTLLNVHPRYQPLILAF